MEGKGHQRLPLFPWPSPGLPHPSLPPPCRCPKPRPLLGAHIPSLVGHTQVSHAIGGRGVWLLLSLSLSLLPPRLPPSLPGYARVTDLFFAARPFPAACPSPRNVTTIITPSNAVEGMTSRGLSSKRPNAGRPSLLFNWNELASSLMVETTALIIKDCAPLVNFRFRFKG